jgi:hypothetical protein
MSIRIISTAVAAPIEAILGTAEIPEAVMTSPTGLQVPALNCWRGLLTCTLICCEFRDLRLNLVYIPYQEIREL